MNRTNLFKTVFYFIFLVIFSMSVGFFYSHLMKISFSISDWPLYLLMSAFWVGLIELIKRYPKQVLLVLLFVVLIGYLYKEDLLIYLIDNHPNLMNQINVTFGYPKFVPELALTPLDPQYYIVVFTLVSALLLWISSQSLISIIGLMTPLFFIEDLSLINWFVPLLLGLSATLVFYNRQKLLVPNVPAIVLIMLSLLLLSQFVNERHMFYYPLNQYINRNNIAYVPPELPFFSLNQVGYNTGNAQVGGPVTLNNDPFMIVDGPMDAFYLKGSAFETFENDIWLKPTDLQKQAFDPSLVNSFDPFYNDFYSTYLNLYPNEQLIPQEVEITPYYKPIQTYFHGGRVFYLMTNDVESLDTVEVDEFGQLTNLEPINDEYTVATNITTNYEEVTLLDSAFTVIGLQENAPYHYKDSIMFENEAVLHDLVYNDLANDPSLINILKVVDHFKNFYRYELEVDHIPNYGINDEHHSNFLHYFFDTKTGYCVYYGSALALLLQDVGIQARYVEGFVVPSAIENSERVVRNSQAHAWTEVFLPAFGWVILDPTPSSHLDFLVETNEQPQESDELPTIDPSPIDNQEGIEDSVDEPVIEEDPQEIDDEPQSSTAALTIIGTLFLIGVFFVQRNRFSKRHDIDYINDRLEQNEKETIIHIYKDIQRIYKLNQPIAINTNSVVETLTKISKLYYIEDRQLIDYSARAINDALYSPKQSHPLAIRTLIKLYGRIEKASQAQTNTLKYFLARVLFYFHDF